MKKTTWGVLACLLLALALFGKALWIQGKAGLAQLLIAEAWAATRRDNSGQATLVKPHSPWAWADTHPVAQLRVPDLAVSQYVLNGADGTPLAFAPGLYAGTALPNTQTFTLPDPIIAGHQDTHFAFLKQLRVGVMIEMDNHRGETVTYRVSTINTYDIRHDRLPTFYGGQTLQLVTCAPAFIGEVHPQRRLVVMARRLKKMD